MTAAPSPNLQRGSTRLGFRPHQQQRRQRDDRRVVHLDQRQKPQEQAGSHGKKEAAPTMGEEQQRAEDQRQRGTMA